MTADAIQRRIYVACLAAYNNGTLHGEWIDAEQSADDIRAEVATMLRKSPYPNVEVECPDCDGTGKTSPSDPTVQPVECETCHGKGKVPSAEEWAIHDYEGFGAIKLSESESFDTVAELAAALEEHGTAFMLFYANHKYDYSDGDVLSAVSAFEERFSGEWDSLADYVEDFWEQTGDYKRDDKNWWSPINYVDWERMAHDLETSGDVHTVQHEGKVYVFRNT